MLRIDFDECKFEEDFEEDCDEDTKTYWFIEAEVFSEDEPDYGFAIQKAMVSETSFPPIHLLHKELNKNSPCKINVVYRIIQQIDIDAYEYFYDVLDGSLDD